MYLCFFLKLLIWHCFTFVKFTVHWNHLRVGKKNKSTLPNFGKQEKRHLWLFVVLNWKIVSNRTPSVWTSAGASWALACCVTYRIWNCFEIFQGVPGRFPCECMPVMRSRQSSSNLSCKGSGSIIRRVNLIWKQTLIGRWKVSIAYFVAFEVGIVLSTALNFFYSFQSFLVSLSTIKNYKLPPAFL